jgi:hypothetical protein
MKSTFQTALHRGKKHSFPRAGKLSLFTRCKSERNFHHTMQKTLATLFLGAWRH